MNIFSLIGSILIYTTYSQQCSNTHTQSTLFSISINKAVTNTEGGVSNYIDIIKQAADAILPTSSNIAVATYGGVNSGATTTIKGGGFTAAQGYSDITSTIDAIASENFANNFGNVVSDALQTAIDFDTDWSGQRYHVLFSTSNPLRNGFGTSTSPDNFNDPCPKAVAAKQDNIQTYVVLIGTQGRDYVKEYFHCLVEDKTLDIIEVDPLTPSIGISSLRDRMCKTDGIDIQITEVYPTAGTYPYYIEVLNRGRDAIISSCFQSGCSNSFSIATGEYFVGYGGSGSFSSNASAGNCEYGACYNDGLGPADAGGNWIARAQVEGITIQTIVKDATFQAQTTDHSYALRAVGFNNVYGANWRMSCSDAGGTPGSAPANNCTAGGTCIDSECQANGGAYVCNTGNDYCVCTPDKFSDAETCIDAPTIETNCTGYVIAHVGYDWTYITFDMEYDGLVSHTTNYADSSTTTDIFVSDSLSTFAVYNLYSNGNTVDVGVRTTINSPIGNVDFVSGPTTISCLINTLIPTPAPSEDPTQSPNNQPSGTPTKAPTYDYPGVYISSVGVCGIPRCSCFDTIRACCIPFGPQYNATTLTAGFVPNSGCPNQFKYIEVTPAQQSTGLMESIFFGKYGATAETTIYYTITSLGQINKTDFEDLSKWTDYYDTAPSPTNEYGNKLNIDVRPPGGNLEYSGSVVIASGNTETVLKLNISTGTLECDQGADCTTYKECQETAMAYMLIVTNCSTTDPVLGDSCDPLYPTTLWISVARNNELCGTTAIPSTSIPTTSNPTSNPTPSPNYVSNPNSALSFSYTIIMIFTVTFYVIYQ